MTSIQFQIKLEPRKEQNTFNHKQNWLHSLNTSVCYFRLLLNIHHTFTIKYWQTSEAKVLSEVAVHRSLKAEFEALREVTPPPGPPSSHVRFTQRSQVDTQNRSAPFSGRGLKYLNPVCKLQKRMEKARSNRECGSADVITTVNAKMSAKLFQLDAEI